MDAFDPQDYSGLQRMRSGKWYLCHGAEIAAEQQRSARILAEFNRLANTDMPRGRALIRQLTRADHAEATVHAPAHVEFGENVHLGRGVFINYGVTVLSSAEVTVGERTMIGPGCRLITPTHPTEDVAMRRGGWERAAPVHIGADVWLASGVTVLPGVSIGDGTTVGANSTVTRDLPAGVVAVGTPARVVRRCGRGGSLERAELDPGAPVEPELD